MIDEIVQFFKDSVALVDPDLKFDKFVFDTPKDGDLTIDNTYKLVMGALSPSRQDSQIQATVPITLVIWKRAGFSTLEEDFQEIYCKAIEIHATCMNQTRVDQTSYIKSVDTLSVEPTPLESNDNTIRMNISFEVSVTYGVNNVGA